MFMAGSGKLLSTERALNIEAFPLLSDRECTSSTSVVQSSAEMQRKKRKKMVSGSAVSTSDISYIGCMQTVALGGSLKEELVAGWALGAHQA